MTDDILNLETTYEALEYIADSPDKEHGGFDTKTIQIASSALYHLKKKIANVPEAVSRNAVLADGWRRAEDGFPDEDGEYLVMWQGSRFLADFQATGICKWFVYGQCGYKDEDVTHWMPCPKPPTVS